MMKKYALTFLLLILSVSFAKAQLLYKISGNGLEKPSYIIGTFHLANVGFVHRIAGVKEALMNTEQVYGEVKWSDMNNPDSVKYMRSQMLLPDGKTLKDVLSPGDYAKLDAFLVKTMGVGFKSPEVRSQMGSLSPCALGTQLLSMLFLEKHMGEFDPSGSFDQYFQAQAKVNKEPVGGLETVKQQVKILLKSTTMKRQIESLMCIVNHANLYVDQMDDMAKAYYSKDLNGLKAAMDRKINDLCDPTSEEMKILLDGRNEEWMKKLPTIMAERPTFFAVGAGHLVGEKGLLNLLKEKGYEVEAVN